MAPYKRCFTLDFLDRCSPQIREFYEYWESARRGRPMPARADIDPVEIPRLLPSVVLVDVGYDPVRLRYRLVGTREVEVRGYDPTGLDVAQHGYGTDREEVFKSYMLVVERKALVYDEEPADTQHPVLREVGTLMAPLSTDGERVDMIFAYVDYR
jgi:hypothetical protein